MDTLCRICIEQVARCTSLSSKIEDSSNKSYFDFLNKCTTLNARESDSLPQSLCSVCANAMKTFYSFMKLAEKSDLILREALGNLIAEGRYNDRREIPCEEIAITKKIEEGPEDFNQGESFHCQPSKNSTEKQLCMLDIVKKESRTTESTSIVDVKNAGINETEKFHSKLDHPEGNIEGLDDILLGVDRHLTSIDAKHYDSEDDVPISLLKSRLAKDEDGADFQSNSLSEAFCIPSNVQSKIGITEAKSKEDSFHCQRRKNSTESSPYILDLVKEEPRLSESASIVAEIDEGESNLNHPKKSIEEPDDFLSSIDRLLASIDIEHTDSKDDIPTSTLKRKFAKSEDEADSQRNGREEITVRKKTIRHGCKICGKKFNRKSNLKAHLDNHNGIRPKCDQCGKDYQSLYNLSRHMKWHANPKPFKCENCGQLFCRKDPCVKHTVICKRRSKLQQFKTPESISALKTPELKTPESISILKTSENDCGICGKTFSRKDNLHVHMKIHLGIIPKCDICGKVFERGDSLRRHMKMHNNPKRFNCEICGKSLSSYHSSHMETCKPPGEPLIKTKFDCELCGQKFTSKYYLSTHMDSHKGISKKCDQCGKEFKHGNSLRRHMEMHNNPKRFNCEICGKSLSSYHSKHIEYCRRPGEPLNITKVECEICGKKYCRKETLDIHMELHKGVTRKCDQCGKEFKHRLSFTRHMRWHKNPRPFKCEYCGKTLARKRSYDTHKKICKLEDKQQQLKTEPIHTEQKKHILSPAMLLLKNAILRREWDKQFRKNSQLNSESHNGIINKCDQCGKEFKTSLSLKSHMERNPQSLKCENCGVLFAWKCTYTRHVDICKGPGQPNNTYMDSGHKDICKPIDNTIDDTVTTEDPHLHCSGNNDIVEIT